MNALNSAAITLTDGSITYKLGDAAHLSTAEKAVNGPMDGAVDAEARVPLAIATAFEKGQLGIMDYYQYKNIMADTQMREGISRMGDDDQGSQD